MLNMYLGLVVSLSLLLTCYLYYKNHDKITRTMVGVSLVTIRICVSLLQLLVRSAKDIEKMKEEQKDKIFRIDETLNHTYREVLGLHEKRGGIFKLMRKEFKNVRELERILEDEKDTIDLIRKENLCLREIIEKAKADKGGDDLGDRQ